MPFFGSAKFKTVDGSEVSPNERYLFEVERRFGTKSTFMKMTLAVADFERWSNGSEAIQDALPYLSLGEREFLLTGLTPDKWDEMWKEPDEDDDDGAEFSGGLGS